MPLTRRLLRGPAFARCNRKDEPVGDRADDIRGITDPVYTKDLTQADPLKIQTHDTAVDRYYRPELDVLRFLAFLSVFIVHRLDHLPIDASKHFWLYNICLLGNFGVPVFFLLS